MKKIYIHDGASINEMILNENTVSYVIQELEKQIINKVPIPVNDTVLGVIGSNIFEPERDGLKEELYAYFYDNDIIDIGGYVTFRMERYHVRIYAMLCSVIRRGVKGV